MLDNEKLIKIFKKSFTLLEVVVVLGVFSMLALIAIPDSLRRIETAKVENFSEEIVSLLKRFQLNAFSGKESVGYGIKFFSDRYILFTGESFDLRSSEDIVVLPQNLRISEISLNGFDEIFFSRENLFPSNFGAIKVRDNTVVYIISINSEGLIYAYQEI